MAHTGVPSNTHALCSCLLHTTHEHTLTDTCPHPTQHKDTVEHVWHTLEYLGNTVLFILAGVIIGASVVVFSSRYPNQS